MHNAIHSSLGLCYGVVSDVIYFSQHVLGKVVTRPAMLDKELNEELMSCSKSDDDFQVDIGTTMCTLDFYEGQLVQLYILRYYVKM